MRKLKTLGAVVVAIALSGQPLLAAEGGASSSGPCSPECQIIQEFNAMPDVAAQIKQLIALGYTALPAQATILSGVCEGQTPEGYAGRCVTQYLVTTPFLSHKGPDWRYQVVSAMIVKDNYSAVPGADSQESRTFVPMKRLQKAADLLLSSSKISPVVLDDNGAARRATWSEASQYCENRGGRLPTLLELIREIAPFRYSKKSNSTHDFPVQDANGNVDFYCGTTELVPPAVPGPEFYYAFWSSNRPTNGSSYLLHASKGCKLTTTPVTVKHEFRCMLPN